MSTQVILIRGINVGGKNPVAMSGLRELLEELGCTDVATYLASGNAIVDTTLSASDLQAKLEQQLPKRFALHDEVVKVLVLSAAQLQAVVRNKPRGFGDEPDRYHSDAIFLMDVDLDDALTAFDPREGVDAIWPGAGVVYSRRLSAERTKSKLNKIMSTPYYKSMTIRSWATTRKLAAMLDAREATP